MYKREGCLGRLQWGIQIDKDRSYSCLCVFNPASVKYRRLTLGEYIIACRPTQYYSYRIFCVGYMKLWGVLEEG